MRVWGVALNFSLVFLWEILEKEDSKMSSTSLKDCFGFLDQVILDPNETSCTREELIQEIDEVLTDLISLGYPVQAEPQPDLGEGSCVLARVMSNKIALPDLERPILATIERNVSSATLQQLVSLRETIIFEQEVDKLKFRLAKLGVACDVYANKAQLSKGVVNGTLVFSASKEGLYELMGWLARAEQRQILLEHMDEFERAGMLVTVYQDTFEYQLRANDSVIERRLTEPDVQEILAIARSLCRK